MKYQIYQKDLSNYIKAIKEFNKEYIGYHKKEIELTLENGICYIGKTRTITNNPYTEEYIKLDINKIAFDVKIENENEKNNQFKFFVNIDDINKNIKIEKKRTEMLINENEILINGEKIEFNKIKMITEKDNSTKEEKNKEVIFETSEQINNFLYTITNMKSNKIKENADFTKYIKMKYSEVINVITGGPSILINKEFERTKKEGVNGKFLINKSKLKLLKILKSEEIKINENYIKFENEYSKIKCRRIGETKMDNIEEKLFENDMIKLIFKEEEYVKLKLDEEIIKEIININYKDIVKQNKDENNIQNMITIQTKEKKLKYQQIEKINKEKYEALTKFISEIKNIYNKGETKKYKIIKEIETDINSDVQSDQIFNTLFLIEGIKEIENKKNVYIMIKEKDDKKKIPAIVFKEINNNKETYTSILSPRYY